MVVYSQFIILSFYEQPYFYFSYGNSVCFVLVNNGPLLGYFPARFVQLYTSVDHSLKYYFILTGLHEMNKITPFHKEILKKKIERDVGYNL